MTANPVNGSGNAARSGAQVLGLLSAALVPSILKALSEGPKQRAELKRQAASQTGLRSQLQYLAEIEAIERNRRNGFPGAVEYELTPAGRDLLFVAGTIEGWLARSPNGPLQLGSDAAKAAIKALAEGWSTTMLHALATGPLSLTGLDRVISSLSYPSIERRLAALRLAGQVEATAPDDGRRTPYELTEWAREGIAGIVAAARWERRHMAQQTPPIGHVEAETVLMLSVPLLGIAEDMAGVCRLGMEIPSEGEPRLAGVIVTVDEGRVQSCTSRMQGNADAWALGSPSGWLEAIARADTDGIERGGDGQLARALLDALHRRLFGARLATHSKKLDLKLSFGSFGLH